VSSFSSKKTLKKKKKSLGFDFLADHLAKLKALLSSSAVGTHFNSILGSTTSKPLL
jgi:hypothetical protein